MAIIVDNQDEHSEELVMADDGSGHSIHIPSFIIRKSSGEAIKQTLSGSEGLSVYIKGELHIARPDNRVEYDLWYSSILDMDYSQLNDLGLY